MPGSSLPSRNSRLAPPPVETWVNLSASFSSSTAATESPPPTITVAPSWARLARKRAMARVPSPKVGTSNTPSGPFQTTVLRRLERLLERLVEAGPTSTADQELGILWAGTILCSAPRVTSLATTMSVGSRNWTPLLSAVSRMRLASSTRSFSSRLLPTE